MPSSGVCRNVDLVSTNVSPKRHTRSMRRHIPEDGILHSHRCENLTSYMTINLSVLLKGSLFLEQLGDSIKIAFHGINRCLWWQ
jgi:hypothetical protein